MDQPATKQDLKDAIGELKVWILEREVQSIRWFVTLQLAYFTFTMGLTVGAMYFMLQHFIGAH
jgi:hypothetical protein